MKKNTLIKSAIALAVVGATTVTTIADTNLYGRFRAAIVCNDVGNGADTDCGLENRSSRFGIKANQDITDGLTAFGRYEFGVNLDEGHLSNSEGTNRLAYVGLKGGFGELSLGTRWSPMYNVIASPVDPQQLLGGTWSESIGYQSTYRRADSINYKNKFGPANLHVMVVADDGDAGSDFADETQVGASLKLGTIDLGLAFRDVADGDSQIGVHAGTKFGPIGLGVSLVSTDDIGEDILGLVSYGLGGGKTVNLSFGTESRDVAGAAERSKIGVEYEHKLSKGYRWFAAVENEDLDNGGDDTLRYGAGMRLEF